MKKEIFVFAIVVLFSFSITASAESLSVSAPSIDVVVDNVQKRYENTKEFHATFEQTAPIRALGTEQKARGEVWFKKPGMMRWNYYYPHKDEIVSDGSTFWYFYSEEKQVIQSKIDDVVETPGTTTFLQGLGTIKKQFKAKFSESGATDNKGYYVIDLEPRDTDSDEVNKFTIVVDPKEWIVSKLYLFDPFDNKTTIHFNDIEINKGISNKLFTFKVPKGVEVITPPQQ